MGAEVHLQIGAIGRTDGSLEDYHLAETKEQLALYSYSCRPVMAAAAK